MRGSAGSAIQVFLVIRDKAAATRAQEAAHQSTCVSKRDWKRGKLTCRNTIFKKKNL